MYVTVERTRFRGGREWENFSAVVEGRGVVEWRVTLVRTALMPSPDAAARHTGAGVARRQAHHERMRDERAREAAAGDAELPPEDDAVEMASAVHVLDSVAEVGPNYTLLRSKETKAKRRKRQREDARAALDGHTVLSTGSRLEIFCDSERWYPATVMAREEDGDGRIVHEVEYDGYSDRRWWHMLDDERWRAVPEQAGAGAGGAAADGDGDAAMDRADGEQGARAAGAAEAAEVRPAPPPVRRGVRRSALADALEAEDDERQEEAALGDGRPMLAPHGPALSAHLRVVRLRLREFLATQAAAGKSVPMQRTALGLHPTMRWTIRFGKWLATTRITAPRASRWHATERGDARDEEPTVRTGRVPGKTYVHLRRRSSWVRCNIHFIWDKSVENVPKKRDSSLWQPRSRRALPGSTARVSAALPGTQ